MHERVAGVKSARLNTRCSLAGTFYCSGGAHHACGGGVHDLLQHLGSWYRKQIMP